MADSGWDIAMRRIDNEFDVPQFIASSLVRKIAANGFRLSAADRGKFKQLPDHVIERIEQIVREAFLEAGQDVGGDISSEDVWQQALTWRRKMVADGELISEADFRQRLGLTQRRLSKLLADGSVFTQEVDNVEYYPALLAEPGIDHKRLQAICRMLVPAPVECRLDFLSSTRGSLGGRSPTQMLDDDGDFKRVQRSASAWAAEWSRTAVKLYRGEHETEPAGVEPLYTATVEIDPRNPLWERASEALHVDGYQWPLGPYPDVRKFTLFVERQTAGDATPTPEACVQIVVDGDYVRVRIVAAPGTVLRSETVPSSKTKGFIDVAKRVISHLLTLSAGR
ncbi:hypothetical protein PQR71_12470 [Paraburkholderia fungorum]|uniref:hypothetical protein n=1 Tax=Paraburkholderia fungorum TaxID=134537 RepID=UPI0038B9F7CA